MSDDRGMPSDRLRALTRPTGADGTPSETA